MDEQTLQAIDKVMASGERGALLLTNEDGGIVFRTEIDSGVFLGFDYRPENYPRISGGISQVVRYDELAKAIQRYYAGWQVIKNNFDVPTIDGLVAPLEEESNSNA